MDDRFPRWFRGAFRCSVCLFAGTVSLFNGATIGATSYTASAGGNWGDSSIWGGSGFPNAAGDTASVNFGTNHILADSAGLDASFTLAAYNNGSGGQGNSNTISNVTNGVGVLIMDNGLGTASMTSSKTNSRAFNVNVGIQLNSNFSIGAKASVMMNFTKGISSGAEQITGIEITANTGTAGTGTVTLSGVASSYIGNTQIDGNTTGNTGAGRLRIGLNDALPTGTVLTVNGSTSTTTATAAGGRFDLNGFNQTVAGLSGGGGTALGTVTNLGTGTTTKTFTVNNAANYDFSGQIINGTTALVAFTKSGAGVQILSGVNTYTGATTITNGVLEIGSAGTINNTASIALNGGTLRYNSSTAYSGGAITNTGGTISGTGDINAVVNLDSLADKLAPGNSPGIQEYVPAQNWSSFTYLWELNSFTDTTAGTDYDQIQATGGLNLSGGANA